MKVVLCGAFGKLGSRLLYELVDKGYDVTAADVIMEQLDGIEGKYKSVIINAQKPESLVGLFDGADLVITTVGLTVTSTKHTNYDIDLTSNLNIMKEAVKAGVKHFDYVSIIRANEEPTVPMLAAKAQFEEELKNSGMTYTIFRPTGYFSDIMRVFEPMIERGQINLIGDGSAKCNLIRRRELAKFIVEHLTDENKVYSVGGKETYTYLEIAKMIFEAYGKPENIKFDSPDFYDKLALVDKLKRNGKEAILRFSKWTLTTDLIGEYQYGEESLKEYIKGKFTAN